MNKSISNNRWKVEWEKPENITDEIELKNLRFGKVITGIIAKESVCYVTENALYTLKINGNSYPIKAGKNVFELFR